LVQRAFRQLHFAHPGAHVQPEGNLTLVNLPTYYQVRWSKAGFEPGEEARVRLLGRTVRLRPRAVSYTYRFGDGSRLGPTSDAGGPYPGGRVRHTYERTGDVPVSVDASYTGDYQLGDGAWEPIDLTVPVGGDPVTVQVRQARARLEASPR
ncbi:MAG: PKD domain-containing protein, partial [Angustibacter sp.]